jgi:hypothetical protein
MSSGFAIIVAQILARKFRLSIDGMDIAAEILTFRKEIVYT